MHKHARRNSLIAATAIFIGLPLLLWSLGDFPRRTILKESLALLFLLAFCQMLGQFFLARGKMSASTNLKMSTAGKFHKIMGYICVGVFLMHPFLLVVPRYFESGMAPTEAFITIITTVDSSGIVLGIVAWCLLLLLGLLSLIRRLLPLKHTTWRILHGIQAMVILAVATWHVVDLGRHADLAMSTYLIILAVSGELAIFKLYIAKPTKAKKIS
ncbi:MAG: ferric reductase-like transmembrane domain-containing protein [Candidatus Chlorobium antarcticum]|nr:ferric reductase-like transmembrane domain-containing protein [Candidatus Chlorobium antarcticum]